VSEQDNAIDVGDRKRPQRDRVDHAEDGGVRSKPEREREYDRSAHGGTLEDGAERMAYLESERAHDRVSVSGDGVGHSVRSQGGPLVTEPDDRESGSDPQRVGPIPDRRADRRGRTRAAGVLLEQVPEDRLASIGAAQHGGEQTLRRARRPWWVRHHDPSRPSRPCQSFNSESRLARSAASPAGVTR
jgi:hypothetical protein